MTILGLATGVLSKMVSHEKDTRVDITIFAPASFLSANKNTVFFNMYRDTELLTDAKFNFSAYGNSILGYRYSKTCKVRPSEERTPV
jgi:hypothetical protein